MGHLETVRIAALLSLLTATTATAQSVKADYERAEQFLGQNARLLVAGDAVRPVWLPGSSKFWYRRNTGAGSEFIAVDPVARTRQLAFDHSRLAAALSLAMDTAYEPAKLPFHALPAGNRTDSARSAQLPLRPAG